MTTQATRLLRERSQTTSVVMLTMHADNEVLVRAVRAGAAGYLVKDCTTEEVVRTVRLAAGGGQALSPDEHLRQRIVLAGLLHEQPRRSEAFAEFAGAETLLHGDLWTTNTFVIRTSTGLRARLIDWDHAGVGPMSYDLSTFLLRFPPDQRLQLLEIYREAVAEAGWQVPGEEVLNLLFETAEYGRFANRIIWPAIALVHDRAEWPIQELAEVERWFQDWRPVLPAPEAVAEVERLP